MGFDWDIGSSSTLSTHGNRMQAHLERPARTPSLLENNKSLQFCTASLSGPVSEQPPCDRNTWEAVDRNPTKNKYDLVFACPSSPLCLCLLPDLHLEDSTQIIQEAPTDPRPCLKMRQGYTSPLSGCHAWRGWCHLAHRSGPRSKHHLW